jgi:hypothetical protein
MTNAPTATLVIDRFLAARAASVAPRTYERDCEAIGWFREFVEARGMSPIDDLTARRLARGTGRAPTAYELDAVLGLVAGVTEFFGAWLPATMQATRGQTAMAAIVIRLFGRWLLERGLVDDDVVDSLARFTQLYDHGSPRRTAIGIAADI